MEEAKPSENSFLARERLAEIRLRYPAGTTYSTEGPEHAQALKDVVFLLMLLGAQEYAYTCTGCGEVFPTIDGQLNHAGCAFWVTNEAPQAAGEGA